jgi:hypothetical protein
MSSNAIHGKSAIIYVSPDNSSTASPVGEQLDWSIDYDQPLVDVTPLNNSWKNFVKGLAGWTGTFGGNYDSTSKVLWQAGTGSTKSKFYLYPLGVANMNLYYYGSGWIIPGKLAGGSTTAKASGTWKITGDDALYLQS